MNALATEYQDVFQLYLKLGKELARIIDLKNIKNHQDFVGRFPILPVTNVLLQNEKYVWFGTREGLGQARRVPERGLEFLGLLSKEQGILPSNMVRSLLAVGNGSVVVGTKSGLVLLPEISR